MLSRVLVAERIPETERHLMTEIPLAASGPWDAAEREALRVGLAEVDAHGGGKEVDSSARLTY